MKSEKPIAYEHGRTGKYVHFHCWNAFEQEYWITRQSRASIGDIYYGPHDRLRGAYCLVCNEPIVDKFRFEGAQAMGKRLALLLPHWRFEPYGRTGAVACYPPHGTNPDAYSELSTVAFIDGVCGPIYTVYSLR